MLRLRPYAERREETRLKGVQSSPYHSTVIVNQSGCTTGSKDTSRKNYPRKAKMKLKSLAIWLQRSHFILLRNPSRKQQCLLKLPNFSSELQFGYFGGSMECVSSVP